MSTCKYNYPLYTITYTFFMLICLLLPDVSLANKIAVVAQTAGRVEFFETSSHQLIGGLKIGYLPHEIELSKDGKTAYVSNFGLQDYDENIGIPGASVSIIDTENMQLITTLNAGDGSAPHGLKLRPQHNQLYVNTEVDNKMLVFNTITRELESSFAIPPSTHNFIFSEDGNHLWLMTGVEGIIEVSPESGLILRQFTLETPIRGVVYTSDYHHLLVSGKNELAIIDANSLSVVKHYKDLQADQILYSAITSDNRMIVAPAVWNNTVLIIDVETGHVIKRIVTGIDPVNVRISADDTTAYVSNARSAHVTAINLKTFATTDIQTAAGPNGIALIQENTDKVVGSSTHPKDITFELGVILDTTGKNWRKSREIMLGLEYWRRKVNQNGGLKIANTAHAIHINYLYSDLSDKNLKKTTEALIKDKHIDMLLAEDAQYEAISSARDHLSANVAIMHFVSSLKQMAHFSNKSHSFKTREKLEHDYWEFYNLKLSEPSLQALLSGVNIELTLREQLLVPNQAGKLPAVLILHPSNGLTPAEERWGKYLQTQGYAVLLVDSFSSRGITSRKEVGFAKASALQLADIKEAYYTMAHSRKIDAHRVALLGFSLGGFSVMKAANDLKDLPIKAVASFYGNCSLLTSQHFDANVHVFIGDKDDRSPASACLRIEAENNEGNFNVTTYDEALHGFDNQDLPGSIELTDENGQTYHLGYNNNAKIQSEQDLLEFYRVNL